MKLHTVEASIERAIKRTGGTAGGRTRQTPDVLVGNAGTVFTFCPLTDRAKSWMDENVEIEPWQFYGATLVVEQRFAWGLAEGMKDAGLILR